jgi:hypothetical protein
MENKSPTHTYIAFSSSVAMIQAIDDYPNEYENTLWEFSLGM